MSKKRNYSEEIETSSFAWKILREILINQEPYTSKIAEKLDTEPQSVSNYIKGLRERGLVKKKEKKGRVQIYEADLDQIYQYWLNLEGYDSEDELFDDIEKIVPNEQILAEISTNFRQFALTALCYHIIHSEHGLTIDLDTTVNVFHGRLRHELQRTWKDAPEWVKWLFIYFHLMEYDPEKEKDECINLAINLAEENVDDSDILERVRFYDEES